MSMSKVPFDCSNYLTVEALEDGLIVTSCNTFEYGIDGQGWTKIQAGENTPSINSGQTISFRGDVIPIINYGVGTFNISKKCSLKGNCMSLLFGDNATDNYSLGGMTEAFYRLFEGCTNIVNVSSNFLPATTLANNCYARMFCDCTSLTTAPELPATTLADSCYSYMFDGCTRLTTAPELPATTLASGCYRSMFSNCRSLTTAPELPATTLAYSCYSYMFDGCTSLVNAPELPATTLASSCYYGMFRGCTKLNYIKALFTTTPSYTYTSNWVNGVATTGTFVKNKNATWNVTGVDGIPSGWTVVNDGEESVPGFNFPVTLVEGDNGQVGIDLYNFLLANKIYDERSDAYYYNFKEGEDVKFTAFGVTENIKQFTSAYNLDGDIAWRTGLTNFGNSPLSFHSNGHVNVNWL